MIPFGDLARQYAAIQPELDAAALGVLQSGWYILGPRVREFEAAWAAACGVAHGVGVATGTDALLLALRAAGIVAGDEVITAPNAAGYTAFALRQIGARPVYADIDPDRWTLDPAAVARAVTPRTKAIVPVHLFGCPADLDGLVAVAAQHDIALIEDCAQAHATTWQGRPVGSFGLAATWSFYPTKNLGALGDGGAITTDDPEFAARVRQLRQYGWSSKYHAAVPFGSNSRLDELQAALLHVKLAHLDAWTMRRRDIAAQYRAALADLPGLALPLFDPGHVFHLFVVRVLGGRRDAVRAALTTAGIGTDIHYPLIDQRQAAFADLGLDPATTPVADQQAGEILSLPCFPELRDDEIAAVAAALRAVLEQTELMEAHEYEVMAAVEGDHWWYSGMRAITAAWLDPLLLGRPNVRSLDAGCGTGANVAFLGRYGPAVGVDLVRLAATLAEQRVAGQVAAASVLALPFEAAAFDLVTSFDVLYHRAIPDVGAAIAESARVLKPGGWLYLRLPAYQWLSSAHDRSVHGARRFTAGQARQLIAAAGLDLARLSYCNTLLFPVSVAQRLPERLRPPAAPAPESAMAAPPPALNRALRLVLDTEAAWLARGGRFPWGVSLAVLAQKPTSSELCVPSTEWG